MNILLNIPGTVSFTREYWLELLDVIFKWFLTFGKNVLIALLVLFVGKKLVKWLVRIIGRSLEKTRIEATVSKFIISVVKVLLFCVLSIVIIGILGIPATSFVAVLSTAGLTVGLALQGSLSNFAGGVLILFFKPFVIGDYIREDSKGNEGTVVGIDLFYTKLVTVDNKTVIVPNGTLANSSMINYTAQKKRRVVITVGISYDSDIKLAKETLYEVIRSEPDVLNDEKNHVYVDSLGDSQVVLGTRVWVPTDKYTAMKWKLTERYKYALEEKGIEIPFNQLSVTLKNDCTGDR